jgi:hypothetical protein
MQLIILLRFNKLMQISTKDSLSRQGGVEHFSQIILPLPEQCYGMTAVVAVGGAFGRQRAWQNTAEVVHHRPQYAWAAIDQPTSWQQDEEQT